MTRFIFLFSIYIFSLTTVVAQSQSAIRKEYLHGWEMYKTGHYDMAMEILKPLTLPDNESTYSPYAGYYYSLAAFNKGYQYLAEEMLKSLLDKYPKWDQVDYVNFWLTKIYFSEIDYSNALASAIQVKNPTLKTETDNLVKQELSGIDSLSNLISFYHEFPDYQPLGEVIADRIVMQPILNQDRILLKEIVQKFDLSREKYNIIDEISSTKKEEYNIAVLFPFMLSDIVPNQVKRSNEFILDMYEGMKVAQHDLRKKGIRLNLYAFDTKMDSVTTRKIVQSGQLDGVDLIIGPLYPDPVRIISEFSFKNRINMFNPLSTNSDLIANNPFSFLMKPSAERQSMEAGKYVRQNLENPNGLIFYERSERDSIMAFNFKKEIEKDSFNIVMMKEIRSPDSVNVYNFLTYKINFEDLAYTGEDSLRIIGRYHLERMIENYQAQVDRGSRPRPMEVLMIAPDSLGFIFVASNSELIGANTISGVETRGDHIMIIGNENWLDFKSLSLEQLEMLNIVLIAPAYVTRNNPNLQSINVEIIESVHKIPNKYHYTGYELIHFAGEMLHSYGVYFQTGMQKIGKYPGVIFEGFDYTEGNDNAVVPLIRFEDTEFKVVN